MLPVPAAALSPTGADGGAGVECGDHATAILTVGILIHVLCRIIAGLIAMRIGHQGLQLAVKCAGRH